MLVHARPLLQCDDDFRCGWFVAEALKKLGAHRIGLVTPFGQEANRNVEAYFAALGFSVARAVSFSSAQKGRAYTARITEAEMRDAFARVDTPDGEVLLQVGTALVCAGFAADLEADHGKPVIAVNTATYWLALRQHGIADSVDGHGVLLMTH